MNQAPRVYIVESSPRFNVSGALEYGSPVYVLPEGHSPFNIDRTVDEIATRLHETGFRPSVDFIAMTGSPISLSVFLSLAFKNTSSLRLLLFDARTSDYVERIMTARPHSGVHHA